MWGLEFKQVRLKQQTLWDSFISIQLMIASQYQAQGLTLRKLSVNTWIDEWMCKFITQSSVHKLPGLGISGGNSVASSPCLTFQVFIQNLWSLALAHTSTLTSVHPPELVSISRFCTPQACCFGHSFLNQRQALDPKKIQSDFPNSEFEIMTKKI